MTKGQGSVHLSSLYIHRKHSVHVIECTEVLQRFSDRQTHWVSEWYPS